MLDFLFEYIIDFVFLVLVEEFGWIGVVMLFVLYLFVVGCCLWIVVYVCDMYV